MFGKKIKCGSCGEVLKKSWEYCPKCGAQQQELDSPFKIFDELEKEFSSFFKFPKIDIGFGPAQGGSFSISVTSGTGIKPKVSIKTTGDFKALEPELKRRMGVKPGIEESEEEEERTKIPKITEEPETKIETTAQGQKMVIKLPDVKSEKDISIRRVGDSIEIKAIAGDKVYFKLLPISAEREIKAKDFRQGELILEISR